MRQLRLLVSGLSLFALIAACGMSGGSSSDEDDTRGYSARSAQLGRCEPFSPTQRFAPDEAVCVDLMLEGYYTAGTLTARFYLEDQEVGQSTIEFNSWKALGERLTYGEAVSHVSFTLHHEGAALPISDAYSVAIERSGQEVARYRFAVAEP